MRHHIRAHQEKQLGDIKFTFSVRGHYSSAFRRQVGEAVAIKLSIGDIGKLNLNSKIEYNRCLIPDITSLESK